MPIRNKALESAPGDKFAFMKRRHDDRTSPYQHWAASAAAAGKRIICQCEYGMSRSAGCAAAILEYYQHSGITVFADDRYCPNKAVFRKLLAALKKHTGFDTVQR